MLLLQPFNFCTAPPGLHRQRGALYQMQIIIIIIMPKVWLIMGMADGFHRKSEFHQTFPL